MERSFHPNIPIGLFVPVILCAITLEAHAQQVADPGFDATVSRPAFKDKHPKVLFDEAHFNFHTAAGRYKPFVDLITSDGYQVTSNNETIRSGALDGYDILVIANALGAERMNDPRAGRSAFTDEECDAIHDWVRAGGCLLLITDHAPMGSAAKNLGRRFGIAMSGGYTYDPEDYDTGSRSHGLRFTRENKLLSDHAITRGRNEGERVNRVTTFTGQSLKGPEGSHILLRLSDTAIDVVPPDGKRTSAAGRAQGIAFLHGEGRVVALGEAACLTAQVAGPQKKPVGMNVPGTDNRRLALNIMHWLSGLLD